LLNIWQTPTSFKCGNFTTYTAMLYKVPKNLYFFQLLTEHPNISMNTYQIVTPAEVKVLNDAEKRSLL
jgi:hypothetical protein